MTYIPTVWINGQPPAIDAVNLGKIETELAVLDARSVGVITVEDYGAVGDGVTSDTVAFQNALAVAAASSPTPVILLRSGSLYRTGTALTPFSGMRLASLGRGSEFDHGAIIKNTSTDIFTPTADVTDIHIEGIQFQGNGGTLTTDWWTVGTGFHLTYSTIEKCGFEFFKRVYHGVWVGVTFKDFYCNNGATNVSSFYPTGADSIFGPGFIGFGGFYRTTLAAPASAGATSVTVTDPTGAFSGGIIYVGNVSDGSSATRDVHAVSGVAGSVLSVPALTYDHLAGEYVHIVINTPTVEIGLSHSIINRLYISPGPGMALHVTGGHGSLYFDCELSGVSPLNATMAAAGPGIYIVNGTGHVFQNCKVDAVALSNWSQFNGAVVIYDSIDISFLGTQFNHINTVANLFRIGRSGGGGVNLTDRIKISGTVRYDVGGGGTITALAANALMAAASGSVTVDFDEWPKSKAGIPTDADFSSMARDGFTITDISNNRLYSRSGGVWKYAALT